MYITLSQSLRDIIPIMDLLQEMRERDFKVICTKPYVYCKVFQDNSGALEFARPPKLCPRNKHINVFVRLLRPQSLTSHGDRGIRRRVSLEYLRYL
jgi:hypothetical protein